MRYVIISILFIYSLLIFGCSAEKTETTAEKETAILKNASQVKVYYFHGQRRCPTCIAVGEVSQTTIAEKFKNNKNVEFIQINIDEPGNEALAKKFQITGSGLVVACNDQTEDITAFAFQNARIKPKKLQNKLIEIIEQHI